MTYRYDTSGNLTDVFDVTGPVPPPTGPYTAALGHTVLGYATPANHLMTTRRSPRYANDTTTVPAPVLKNVYDGSIPPRVVEQTSELGYKTTFSYGGDPAYPGSVIITRPDNNNAAGANKTLDQYLSGVLVTHVKGYGLPTASTWRYVHDPATLGVTRTDAPNGVSLARYDARGNRVWATDPLGRTTEAGFNAFDQPLWVKDAKGTVTTYTYDQGNTGPNLVSTATPLSATQTATTTLFYGERGNPNRGEVTSMVDPERQPATATSPRWQYAYDAYGLRTSVTDPLGHTASQMFDVVGRRTRSANGLGKSTLYEFDPDGLVTKVTDPLGRVSRSSFDADRRPASSIDAKGNRTDVEYDPGGRARKVTRPPAGPGAPVTYLYNEYWNDGSLREQRDGAGAPTRYAYDTQGRLTSETDPANRVTGYGYDQAGNQTTKTNPGGRCTAPVSGCTTMTYDAADELRSVSYSDAPADNVTIPAYPVGYDANGLRRTMTDKTGTSTWDYDLANRLTATKNGAGATTGYTWDRKSQLTGITYPGQSVPVKREFDAAGRLFKITDWLGNPTTFGYDDNNSLTTQTLPAGGGNLVDTFGRNDAEELTQIRIDKGPVSVAAFNYGRDGDGQVSSVTSTGLADSHTYGYTGLNQLSTLDAGAYSHDPADNLIRTPSGGQQTFDAANQLCWTNPTANPAASCTTSVPAGATRYGYDNRGNRTTKTQPGAAALTYGYDQANRMVKADRAASNAEISMGWYHAMAAKTDGTVWTWGYNGQGQLGNGTTTASAVPVQVPGLTGVVAVSAGVSHSLALKSDGTVWAWGANGSGQLGNSSTVDSAVPVQVQGLTAVTAIAAGGTHSLARKADGTVWAWGDNLYGQIGNNSTVQALVPAQVQGLSNVTAIAGGYVTSTALRADGTVWGWGYNGYGQLGNGTTVGSLLPVQAQGLSGVTAIAAGIFHLVALKADGTVWGSGYNGFGQLGNNGTVGALTPVQATGLSGVTTVAAGGYHTLALRSDGSVAAYGYNSYGQLGIGTTTDVRVPQTVTALAGTKALAAGLYNSLAVRADGSVQGSGLNGNGAVGDGTLIDRSTPATASGYNRGGTPLASYTYDGTGARTAKTVAGVRTTFAWDAAHPIPQLLNETNTTTGAVTSYIYGPDGLPIEQITGSSVTWLHHDQLGSTRLLTNNTGATVGTYTYDSFGNPTTQTGPTTTNLRYTGEYTDTETGLQYLRARYYDPATAQFLTRDPLEATTRSAYGYVDGDPLNETDPSGLWCVLGKRSNGSCRGAGFVDLVLEGAPPGLGGDVPPPSSEWTPGWWEKLLFGDCDPDVRIGIVFPMPAGPEPRPSPKFRPPTNSPQLPPSEIPDGWRIRQMAPTSQYPDGYWKLEKPMPNGNWQPIDPSVAMKPGSRPETHIPLPPKVP